MWFGGSLMDIMGNRAVTQGPWWVNVLELDVQLARYSNLYKWMKSANQRQTSDQETRAATRMSFNGRKSSCLYYTLVLPCGFPNQMPTSTCLISFLIRVCCSVWVRLNYIWCSAELALHHSLSPDLTRFHCLASVSSHLLSGPVTVGPSDSNNIKHQPPIRSF